MQIRQASIPITKKAAPEIAAINTLRAGCDDFSPMQIPLLKPEQLNFLYNIYECLYN